MSLRIAIISWGSLIWDPDSKFDRMHRGWVEDGPVSADICVKAHPDCWASAPPALLIVLRPASVP